MEPFSFPQFRKLTNDQSFYRIDDERHFTEKQRIGSQVFILNIEAKQYPEILRIQDMLQCAEGFSEIDKVTFDRI